MATLIYASDLNGSIGRDNELLFRFKVDLQHFKRLTSVDNSVLIVGYNTYVSMKHIDLGDRIFWVLTHRTLDNVICFNSYNELMNKYIECYGQYKFFVIGGMQIFKQFEHICKYVIHTLVIDRFEYDNTIKYEHNKDEFLEKEKTIIEDQEDMMSGKMCDIVIIKYERHSTSNEYEYLRVLRNTITNSNRRETRNGITYSYFADQIKFDMSKGFPLLTTKKMAIKAIIHELLFFIKGKTNTKELEAANVNIWKGNTSREFLDNMGFYVYDEGEMGPMYGYQWRNFNGESYDQLKNILQSIKSDPFSR